MDATERPTGAARPGTPEAGEWWLVRGRGCAYLVLGWIDPWKLEVRARGSGAACVIGRKDLDRRFTRADLEEDFLDENDRLTPQASDLVAKIWREMTSEADEARRACGKEAS